MRRFYYKRKKRRYNRKVRNLKRNEQIRVNNERANDVNVTSDDSREVFEPDDYDAHCCSACDDGNGYCSFCGAVIPGTFAYLEVYGGDAPEIPRYHWSDL